MHVSLFCADAATNCCSLCLLHFFFSFSLCIPFLFYSFASDMIAGTFVYADQKIRSAIHFHSFLF